MRKLLRLTPRQRKGLLIALALYFTFLGGTFVTDHSLWPRIFHHALVTLLLGGWLVRRLATGKAWPSTPMDLLLAVFFLVALVAALFGVDPRMSLEEVWRLGTHILMFYVIVDLMRANRPRAAFEPLFFASAVVILVGFIEFLSWYAGIPPLPFFPQSWLGTAGLSQPIPPEIHRLTFTLSVSTFLSGYLAVLIPVGLAWLISTYSRETRRAMTLWLIGAVIIEILSFSRGGLLALAVSLGSFAALLVLGLPAWRTRIGEILRDKRVIGATVVLIAAAAIVGVTWFRQSSLGGHRSGDVLRWDLWKSAWQIGLDHPVLGVGPYSFGRAMRTYRDPLVTPDHFITPHNVPLYVWAEMGIFGVLALGGLAAALLWSGVRRWRTAQRAERIRVSAACAALLGYSAHNLFDTFTNVTPILLPAVVLLAYLVYPLESPVTALRPVRRYVTVLTLCLLILAGVGWVVSDLAQVHFQRAVTALNEPDRDEALREIDLARRIDPWMGLYAAQRAQILGEMAVEDPGVLPDALDAYETALSYEHTYDLMHANYAKLLGEAGQTEQALSHFQRASEIRPQDPLYHLWIAQTAADLGDEVAARREYETAIRGMPHTAFSDYWMVDPIRSYVRDHYLEQSLLSDAPPEELVQIPTACWGYRGPDEVVEDAIDPYCQGVIALRLDDSPEGAIVALDRVIAQSPTFGEAYAERAAAHLAAGNQGAAARDAEFAVFFGSRRGYFVLGQIAEQNGNTTEAVRLYQAAGPIIVQLQGWDVAVYGRRGNLRPLRSRLFDAPGPPRYDFASWFALMQLYETLGQHEDSRRIQRAIEILDPYTRVVEVK